MLLRQFHVHLVSRMSYNVSSWTSNPTIPFVCIFPVARCTYCISPCCGWAASYQPPPQVADRGTTFRYGGHLRTKRTLVVWQLSSGGPAAAVSSERGGGSRVALSTATKYPHAQWRHCDMASLRLWAAKKAHQPPLPCCQVLNQRLGEGHPDRKPRQAVVLGWMRSEPHERPAVYPALALRATRRSSSLEDQTSSFSTHVFMVLRNRELHARNDDLLWHWFLTTFVNCGWPVCRRPIITIEH